MNFKSVEKKYRPIPFWSWNSKLSPDETKRQIGIMDEAGIGGYFMHARGGLTTEYMSDEWFDNVKAAIEEGDERGMFTWAYDENGWPSGFGGGAVNGLGVKYLQKWLDFEPATDGCENLPETLLVKDGYRYFYKVNPLYVDNLDPEVVDEFIRSTHEKYHERFPNRFEGFFTDEPQIGRGGRYHWSFILEREFTARYGYSLVENLDSLFREVEGAHRVRIDYHHLTTDLFSKNFFKKIYDWCSERGYKQTGHLVCEDNFKDQIICNGSCMPHYEYFHIPGMDWLCRPVGNALVHNQLGSAAAQLGKRQVLSETFALCGHSVTHNHLKRIFEWQMVRGVNLLCTHLEGYSLAGIRKRDYPPAMYYQQPWWRDMDLFFDATSRIGKLLADGEIIADTLLIHPIVSAWAAYDGGSEKSDARLREMDRTIASEIATLEEKHCLFHLGDEVLMERHARVEGARLIVGNMSYKTVVMPKQDYLLPSTEKLLAQFVSQGGRVITPDEVESNPLLPDSPLSFTVRRHDGFDLYYIVNSTEERVRSTFALGAKQLVIESGELIPFYGDIDLPPFGSIVVIDDGSAREKKPRTKPLTELSLLGEWECAGHTYNSITLDKCAYYFDGELINDDGYVLDIIPRLSEIRRPVRVKQVYRFKCDAKSDEMFLATETPEIFEIHLNGKQICTKDVGFFRDKSFRLLPIADAVELGENTLELESTIVQSKEVYEHLDNSWAFETMRNCLSYDMELEPIYIVGDFGARIAGELSELDEHPRRFDPDREALKESAYRISEPPIITSSSGTVDISSLETSGFPELAGELKLRRRFTLTDKDRFVRLGGVGMNAVHITVNGKYVTRRLWAPFEVDLSDYLIEGENEIELLIVNNLRNMMGPHHLREGESVRVSPRSFFRESNVFQHLPGATGACHDVLPQWDEGYCLMHFGF